MLTQLPKVPRPTPSAPKAAAPGRPSAEELWDNEYHSKKTLPSTLLSQPSRCLANVGDLFGTSKSLSVLDIGSGNGRHAAYFAKLGATVHALDISGCAIDIAQGLVRKESLSDRVKFHQASALDFLPAVAGGFDVILDSYMSCHIIDPAERAHLFSRIAASLSRDGIFVSFGVSPDDSFYSKYVYSRNESFARVCDPITGIEKILTTESFLSEELRGVFGIDRMGRVSMSDTINAKEYSKQAIYLAASRVKINPGA